MSDTRKSVVSMRRELTRVQRAMKRRSLPDRVRAELYPGTCCHEYETRVEGKTPPRRRVHDSAENK